MRSLAEKKFPEKKTSSTSLKGICMTLISDLIRPSNLLWYSMMTESVPSLITPVTSDSPESNLKGIAAMSEGIIQRLKHGKW